MSSSPDRRAHAPPDPCPGQANNPRAWGAQVLDGGVRFRVWAPAHERILLRLEAPERELPLQRSADGWHALQVPGVGPGQLYRFVLPDGRALADPASLFQPQGVEGPSEVVDPAAWTWQHTQWKGRPWHETVVYELHVGTFTPEGTFRAAIGRLPHLAALGVTAIEIMPVAAFPGRWNWGYDGVFTYAPAEVYGRPEDLRELVDAAHGHGIMVFLDVVYNHFGPEGNVMHSIAQQFFTERHETPWGAGLNFDGAEPVRQFFIENALHWVQQYRVDGLRLDAVHAIADDSDVHILEAIAAAVHACVEPDRHVHLILENEHNDAHWLERGEEHRPRCYTAQWNDDVHHVLHVAATRESIGYYADYVGDAQKLARALSEGFAFQGEMMPYSNRPRGEPSGHLPPVAFVGFLQNHDQVGNRAMGDRIGALAPPEVVRAMASVYLLLPQVPMLFMGEEWGTKQPFPFFCDFHGDLKQAVVKGRREEFARFPEFSDPGMRERIPDPTSEETFRLAKLRWEELEQAQGAAQLRWYREVLDVRQREILPLLPRLGRGGQAQLHHTVVEVRWALEDGGWLMLRANLAAEAARVPVAPSRRVVWSHGDCNDGEVGPWSVEWSVGDIGVATTLPRHNPPEDQARHAAGSQ